jgi:hypothetical protein
VGNRSTHRADSGGASREGMSRTTLFLIRVSRHEVSLVLSTCRRQQQQDAIDYGVAAMS